jgi:hypothetical protein
MSFDRAQRRYDNASPPEDRPLCEGICGGDADEHYEQHASEDDRDYCADCREGADACARYDLDESEPDDLTNHRAMLLRHLGHEPQMPAEYTPLPPEVVEAHAAFVSAAKAHGLHTAHVDLFTDGVVLGEVKASDCGRDYTVWRDEARRLNVFGYER